jgi:hypothetical protein
MTNEVNIGTGNASGMFYHAPLTPTTPTMPTSPFDEMTGFTEIGYVGEDGPSWTPYGSVEQIKAWSLATVRNIKTEKGTITVPVISTTAESLKTVFGADAVTETAANATHGNIVTVETEYGPYNKNEAFVLIGKDGDDGIMLSCASGIVTEISEIGFAPGGAIIWSITITGDWTFVKDDGQVTTGG